MSLGTGRYALFYAFSSGTHPLTERVIDLAKNSKAFRVDCAHGPTSFAEASQPHGKTREKMKITRR